MHKIKSNIGQRKHHYITKIMQTRDFLYGGIGSGPLHMPGMNSTTLMHPQSCPQHEKNNLLISELK